MKKTLITIVVAIFLTMAMSSVYAASNLWGPTGLLYYDKGKAYPAYTVFQGGGQGWIMDMEGNVCHSFPSYSRDIYPDGHQVLAAENEAGNTGFKEVDWDGNVYGEWYNTERPEIVPHHDQERLFNNKLDDYTMMCIVHFYDKTVADAIANGAGPQCSTVRNNANPSDCGIIEFDRNGNLIWEWRFWNHMVQDYDPTKLNYGDPAAPENWGKLDINAGSNDYLRKGMSPDWNHVNSFNYNETLDQIVMNSREYGEIYVIDHNTTTEEAAGPAGDFLFRWGNPANYRQGDIPTFNYTGTEQLFGAHDIHWIPDFEYPGGPALPGARNFLIFDNGDKKPVTPAHSTILEINPYDGPMSNGVYIWQHDGGYTDTGQVTYGNLSNQVVWGYCPTEASRFNKGMYSRHTSGCQRLPNGNTFMHASEEGHLVEVVTNNTSVTAVDEVVWEWVCPLLTNGTPITWLGPGMDNAVSTGRADRYSLNYPGFAGLDLSPKGKFTERAGIEQIQDKLQEFLAQ